MSGADESSGWSPGDTNVIHAQFDWVAVSPSIAVIETVSIAADRNPTELRPLFETLDPDAFDSLLRHSTASTDELSLSFTVDDRHVKVNRSGDVFVESEPSDG
ncbi:MAG: HalOD1 output domain-containing protein [Haloarcula sp.]